MLAASDTRPLPPARWRRWARRALAVAVGGLVFVAALNGLVWGYGRSYVRQPDNVTAAQAVIVLGAYVFPDGRVSDMLADRLETAFALYRAGKAEKILITGDHGQVTYDEVNTMRQYLEAKGVPTDDIFMDHAGFDTYNSMYRARSVFQVKSALVVTQEFHLTRALYIARLLGVEAEGVKADRQAYAGMPYYQLREGAARIKAFGEVLVHRKPHYLGPVIPISGSGSATHDRPA